MVDHPKPFIYVSTFTPDQVSDPGTEQPHNPDHATPTGYHTWTGLASSAFARHYSRNHMLFSLPAGTEMFHFPAFPPHSLCVQLRVTTHNRQPGFPIRTSWDQSSVINSPRLFADSHVLHRLLMPRHSPCALKNLATQKPRQTPQPPQPTRGRSSHDARLIRCSRPLCSSQTTTPHPHPTHPTGQAFQKQGNQTKQQPPHTPKSMRQACCSRTQQCVNNPRTTTTPHPFQPTVTGRRTKTQHHSTRTGTAPPASKPPCFTGTHQPSRGCVSLIFHP